MSLKSELVKEIQMLEDEIKELETKRIRSMAALMEAMIAKREIGEDEARFFRTYTAEIDIKREKLSKLKRRLDRIQ